MPATKETSSTSQIIERRKKEIHDFLHGQVDRLNEAGYEWAVPSKYESKYDETRIRGLVYEETGSEGYKLAQVLTATAGVVQLEESRGLRTRFSMTDLAVQGSGRFLNAIESKVDEVVKRLNRRNVQDPIH